MADVVIPVRNRVAQALSDMIESASREPFVYIPFGVREYMARAIADSFWERLPQKLDRLIGRLLNYIPQDKLEKYDRLKRTGDIIFVFTEYAGLDSREAKVDSGLAPCLYDDAARIGKKLKESEAPVLWEIAERYDDCAEVIRRIRGKLVA